MIVYIWFCIGLWLSYIETAATLNNPTRAIISGHGDSSEEEGIWDGSWTHEIKLDTGMEVKWNFNDSVWLTMEMSAPTTGYIGLGFSPNGGMGGSDIVLGWIDGDGVPYLWDFHAERNEAPIMDTFQDYELLDAEQKNMMTTLRFRRKWDTCDNEEDMKLGNDTVRLIWAWHAKDPIPADGDLDLHWHGGKNRGVVSVYLTDPGKSSHFPDLIKDPSVRKWDVSVKNVRIPIMESYYHCKIFKFPEVGKKHHIIGYHMKVSEENKRNVHHIVAYQCNVPPHLGKIKDVFEKYLSHPGGDCHTSETPLDWKQYCFLFLIASAIGSEGDVMPNNIGIPMSQDNNDEPTYLKLEVHYDNPEGKQLIDSSGYQIFYTNELREFDASPLFLGHRTSPFHVIPPLQKSFTTHSVCSTECTKNGIPLEGIKLIGVVLHAHRAGRKIRLRHVRDGVELPIIAEDNHFDSNYQHRRSIDGIVILPGDELIVECDYDTSKNSTYIIGGFPTRREMCHVHAWYYPKANLADCRSQPEFYSFFDALGISKVTGDVIDKLNMPINPQAFTTIDWLISPLEDSTIVESEFHEYHEVENSPWEGVTVVGKNISVHEAILNLPWTKAFSEEVEQQWKTGLQYMFCTTLSGMRIPNERIIVPYPNFKELQPVHESNCHASVSSDGIKSTEIFSKLLVPISVMLSFLINCSFY